VSDRQPTPEELRARIRELKDRILNQDLVAGGTLVRRTKVCGKAECRCASDPSARHGPYYEWGRLLGRRRLSTTVSAEKARLLQTALRNQRRLKLLLRRWERESVRVMDAEIAASHDAESS
jgi:hypothetical protein